MLKQRCCRLPNESVSQKERFDLMLKQLCFHATVTVLTFLIVTFIAAPTMAAQSFELRREQETVFFKGEINRESANALIEQIRSGALLIVITSEGGSAKDALDVAREMVSNKVALQVQDYCFSSCANYLFVAAAQKKLMSGAVLGFHGGVYSARKDDVAIQKTEQQSARYTSMIGVVKESSEFYRIIGFDTELLRISYLLTVATVPLEVKIKLGSDEREYRFSSLDEAENFLRSLPKSTTLTSMDINRPSSKAYFPSQHMLMKYGVKGITDYPYPADQAALDVLGKALKLELIGDFVNVKQHERPD